jgi:hypothetical protein
VLYAPDLRWWRVYGAEVEQTFAGERWSCAHVDGVNHIDAVDDPGLSAGPGRINTGGNSGYSLIGLAYLWGAARIILLGYDMQRGPRGESHHHGDHGNGLPNCPAENLMEWARRMLQLGIDLRERGVEVVNATRRTAITCFERLPIEQALREKPVVPARVATNLIPRDLLPREHAAFAAGLAAAGSTATVIWGTYKGERVGTELVAENGYLAGQGGPYVALARGGHNGAGKWPAGSPERWERLGIALKQWRETGSHVLVCPSRGIGMNPAPMDWTERTVAALRKLTKREIRIRPHPGNWKPRAAEHAATLARDLEGAWACVIWASSAGVRSLIEGVPVIYTAPSWICADAAGTRLEDIENPPMPDRLPAFHRLASAQWTLAEIASGAAFRALASMDELTVLCVLKSGGDYNAEYVRILRDGVARHLTIPHRFVCLSDVDVPCERIPLKHGWPGWWSKIEIFRPDVITGKTLYLDLDTIITGPLDAVATIPDEFSMLNIREKDTNVGNSGAMWMAKPFPHVYERFVEKPEYWMDYHLRFAKNRYMGDQAFISDCFPEIPKLNKALPGFFKSYKYDRCENRVPSGCSVVCFGGFPRPHQVTSGWAREAWV